ncbi:MAG: glycosyltransferase, partial [Chloroflexi bacterium]|nr:glycosyltransferase [Chloroflexota bacterium]
MSDNPAVSIIVTAYREAATVGRAIEALLAQPIPEPYELLVLCPDDETATVAAGYAARGVRVLRDAGRGKPAALNLALQEARGEIVVLTDGDVWVEPDAEPRLLVAFHDPRVGIATGHPVSTSSRSTMLGYWSHLLTDAGAHRERLRRDARDEFLVCSGYLYALRRALYKPLPEDALAEDAVISGDVWDQGYLTRYVPEAVVYVQYPTTYRDWVAQKVRSTGGYVQSYAA